MGLIYYRRIAVGIALVMVATGATKPPDPPTQLVSLKLPPLRSDEYVDSFDIKTQGVEILSVCHIPHGWKVTAGIDDSVTGGMRGEAGLGVSFVSGKSGNLSQLKGLFLIRVINEVAKWDGSLPPTFQVSITIGRYGQDTRVRSRRLTAQNLVRTPAKTCPPAPR